MTRSFSIKSSARGAEPDNMNLTFSRPHLAFTLLKTIESQKDSTTLYFNKFCFYSITRSSQHIPWLQTHSWTRSEPYSYCSWPSSEWYPQSCHTNEERRRRWWDGNDGGRPSREKENPTLLILLHRSIPDKSPHVLQWSWRSFERNVQRYGPWGDRKDDCLLVPTPCNAWGDPHRKWLHWGASDDSPTHPTTVKETGLYPYLGDTGGTTGEHDHTQILFMGWDVGFLLSLLALQNGRQDFGFIQFRGSDGRCTTESPEHELIPSIPQSVLLSMSLCSSEDAYHDDVLQGLIVLLVVLHVV